MATRKKIKVKYNRIFICFLVIGLISFLIFNYDKNEKLYMIDLVGEDYNKIDTLLKEYNFNITTKYEYNDSYNKDIIINQSIASGEVINDLKELEITISKGKLDLEKFKNDKIDELGKVPIMMYHGIKNIPSSETKYTGGNVDIDGYTRTAEAFREDLEFYYQEGYRMIKLSDYISGFIDIPYGYSPIVLTFDDGNDNNIKVIGTDTNGNIIIDPNSAVGILEEYKKKYPDYGVTAIFFLTNNLFNQPKYDEQIIKWLIKNGYEIGNHTTGHNNLSNISEEKTEEVIGKMYQKLDSIIEKEYSSIVALPYGSPYNKTHKNYPHILNGNYEGFEYETKGALRVGWEPEVSPYNINFDPLFLKRCRAYDNNGLEFDIKMVFNNLKKNRYISDGDIEIITTNKEKENLVKEVIQKVVLY